MDGKAIKLIKYLDGSEKRFVIPVYQRNYSWKVENCRQLYDDLVKLNLNDRKMHFFGSLVSVYSGSSEEFLIIDGQQRVTTISLLLLAIYNILNEGKLVAEDRKLIEKVYKKYLVDEFDETEKRIKLKAVNKDLEAFEKLFEGDSHDYIPNSDITINYQYFYDRILKEEISIDSLFDSISKLMVINITVEDGDDPQLIFESLNSTGVDLTEGDKIRNYVLMGQSKENQEVFYKKYWRKIEVCAGNDNNDNNGVSLFVRDYLSIMRQSTPAMDKIYSVFKAYVAENNLAIEDLCKELLDYARLYEVLTKSKFDDSDVNGSIYRLNYLETTVSRPFLLQVLKLHKQEVLSVKDLREIFRIVEDYLFRRNICEVPTNSLNKIFLTLNREIHRYDGTYDNYVEKLKYALANKKESGRFPNDDEFSTALSEKQVYLMRSRYKNYLFERLENYGTLETKPIFSFIENGDYTIEHIMPQTITPTWKRSLGDDCRDIHSAWLHRLANLTLTAYNSSYSNRSFLEKRDSEHGFKNSGLKMNLLIAQKEKWTLAELEERDQFMVARALDIWRYPFTEYKPVEKQFDSITLGDDVDATGYEIAKFAYKDVEQSVESWADMYGRVLAILHAEDNSVLTNLAYISDDSLELAKHVERDSTAFNKSNVQIAPHVFVWTYMSTQQKLNTLRKFFALFGADPADLVFYLKDHGETGNPDESPLRYQIRKKYWTFALPYIRERYGDGGLFSDVNPSTSNWVACVVADGVTIVCRANYNCATVQLYFGGRKDNNKRNFDYLYSQKSKIEQELGVSVDWRRGEDIVASYVSYKLDGVSVADETDWIKMAKFHAEWSKKFFDAMFPILKELFPSIGQ